MNQLQAPNLAPSRHPGRSFYSNQVSLFLTAETDGVIGRLSSRHVAFHQAAEAEQIRAWEREIEILRASLSSLGRDAADWWLLIEKPLLRLGQRLDAVVLAPGVVCVVEFKIGSAAYDSAARIQCERYAQSLRDFHEVSQKQLIIPVLCAEMASAHSFKLRSHDGVADLVLANAHTLASAFRLVLDASRGNRMQTTADEFDAAAYRPTPSIVEAAQQLYAGHQIADIGRGDASDAELQSAASLLQQIAADAEENGQRTICFVTGAPGAGKTLLGLDLALRSRSGDRPAALLSGNRPLVHVLTEALAEDNVRRNGTKKAAAKSKAAAAIQNLLGYLKEHTDSATPPENVIIFDEAQRAWDEEVGKELMGRPTSEPELFLDILYRLDWSCLVCLVGPGQEINRGEGGLPLWGAALAAAAASGRPWKIIAAPQALDGGPDVSGAGLLSGARNMDLSVRREPMLHLANSMRAYRNPLQGRWVAALLQNNIAAAAALAQQMVEPPAMLTRNLETAKAWLRNRRRGERSVGLLASSGGVRLVGEGVPPTPHSNELGPIGHWFLKPYTDFRSAGALETPMSEFGCQGLELDYTGLCWDGDLIWGESRWVPRKMSSPNWQISRDPERQRFRLNGYRVLLTRARAGTVIFVPQGSVDDPTREPATMNGVADALTRAGCDLI